MTPDELKDILKEGLEAFRAEVKAEVDALTAKVEALTKEDPKPGEEGAPAPVAGVTAEQLEEALKPITEKLEELTKDLGAEDGLFPQFATKILDRVEALEKRAAGRQSAATDDLEPAPPVAKSKDEDAREGLRKAITTSLLNRGGMPAPQPARGDE